MKYLALIAVLALSGAAFASRHHKSHKSSWVVHRKNGTTYVAHRHSSSWFVRSHTTKKGKTVREHKAGG